jgi:hypothetical protein
MKTISQTLKHSEVWQQDTQNPDLWHGPNGVMINTAALNEREFYYDVLRVRMQPFVKENYSRVYA